MDNIFKKSKEIPVVKKHDDVEITLKYIGRETNKEKDIPRHKRVSTTLEYLSLSNENIKNNEENGTK